MTQSFTLNAKNDIFLNSHGNIDLAVDQQALKNVCQNATQAIKGEIFFFQENGLPNFETVWNGVLDIGLWQSYLQRTLEGIPGVIKVSALTITANNNVLQYSATIETVYGTTTL